MPTMRSSAIGATRSLCVPDRSHGFVPAPSSHQLRVFGAFSRRIREGMWRVEATSTCGDLLASAFEGADGARTVVLLNRALTPARVALTGASGRFASLERVDPYRENETSLSPDPRAAGATEVIVPPGAIATLSTVPLGKLPEGFAIEGPPAADGERPPADLPDLDESSALAAKMPAAVSGTVTLDGKGIAGVRVTDGVGFATTDEAGKYTIPIEPDPLLPYLPSRTIGISWPSGTWPARDGGSGRYRWWIRLKDIQDPRRVDFALVRREAKLSVCVAFGTDPHDALRRPHNYTFRDEIAEAAGRIDFAVMGGDLGYMGFANADRDYAEIEGFTNHFPVPMFHVIGNHDVVHAHAPWWRAPHELAGNGAFTKYLGPIRWSFDYAGIRRRSRLAPDR